MLLFFQVGIFFTIGYFSKRFDERKLLLFVGIIGYMVAIFIFFPIPGNPLPMMAKNQTQNHHLLSGIPNVPCDKDFKEPGCALEWCKYTPAIQVRTFNLVSNIQEALFFLHSMTENSKRSKPRLMACSSRHSGRGSLEWGSLDNSLRSVISP